jgi:hypothetical protein
LPTLNSFLITGGYPSRLESGSNEDDYDPIDGHCYEREESQSMEIYSPDTNTFTLLPWALLHIQAQGSKIIDYIWVMIVS